MKKIFIFLLLPVVLLAPAFYALFHPGFLLTDDGNWMVIRLSAFYEAFRQGQFPIRFLPRLNNGFGYPVADFLYPLFLYLGSAIHVFHINFITTIKWLFGFSLLASFAGSFIWFRKKIDDLSAFVGASVYTLFPYHIWDITKRGSLGEVLALAIVPFIFWSIDIESTFLLSLGIGLLILSHNTLALLFLPVIIGYIFIENKIKHLVGGIFLGLGLSTFFWLPALFDKQFTVFNTITVSNINQYFLQSNLYPLIGIVSFVVVFLSLQKIYKKHSPELIFFLVITFFSISLTNTITKPFWQFFHLDTYVQFPFRFLSITALGVAFLSVYIISNWQKNKIPIALIIIILLYFSSWQFFFPKEYQYYPDSYFSTNQDTTTVKNEYMPIWVKQASLKLQTKVSLSKGKVRKILNDGSSISFQTSSPVSAVVTFATIYFPGWQATVDNIPTKIIYNNTYGFIQIKVPKGDHMVHIWFGETPVRLVSDMVSLFALVVLGCVFIFKERKKHG